MLFGLPDNINDDVTLNLNFKKSGSIKVLARIEVINSAHRMNR
jgi:hypothetical protein